MYEETTARFDELGESHPWWEGVLFWSMIAPHAVCCLLLARKLFGADWLVLLFMSWFTCPFAALFMPVTDWCRRRLRE